jgi:dephospho-CoA kinase
VKKDPLIVGLTGGIGSGKSTVAELFTALGIQSVDADQASRAVVEPGAPALASIKQYFGPVAAQLGAEILLPDGQLNRPTLRRIIFSDPAHKQWLEALLHPLIRDWIVTQLKAATSDYVILESPLLFETDQHLLVDTTVLVDVPVELQIQRASARDDNEPAQIQSIIAAQLPRQAKLKKAEHVVDNSGDITALAPTILALHQQLLELAKQKSEQSETTE